MPTNEKIMFTAKEKLSLVTPKLYFCDKAGELSLMDRKAIPDRIRKQIRELQKLNYTYNYKILFFFALWAVSIGIFLVTESILIHLPLYFLMTCGMVGLSILMHESNHNLLFRNPSLNRWTGFICGLPSLVSVTAYRTLHLQHHAHTSTEKDPDSMTHNVPRSLPMVLFFYLFFFVGAYLYLGHLMISSLKLAYTKDRRMILTEYLLIIGTFALLFWWLPFSVMLHFWLIPMMIAAQLTNIRGLAEHSLTTGNNPFTETRTVRSNAFVSFMMNNLNYHLDHHLFPGVPWYNLPKVHALLEDYYIEAGSSVYPSYSAFVWDFIKVTFAGYIPEVRLIPKHLREDICG